MEDDLAESSKTFDQGGFANLQETFDNIFGKLLYWKSEKPQGSWPTVDELRGRIMVVLSGNRNSRIFYPTWGLSG